MHNLSRFLVFVALSFSLSNSASYPIARQSKDLKTASGSISGRVTLNGKPVPGVPVILARNESEPDSPTVGRATTDEDGRFRIANVPAGSFNLTAFAPAFVFDDRTSWGQPGKRVIIANGETVEGVDISLKRGGVITGKVTDPGGRPIVEERVDLTAIDEQGRHRGFDPISWQSVQTDDRGVYRIFGVPEGRYVASVGEAPNQRSASVGRGNTYYPMTFHPGVTDESKATVIELAAGAESTGVDIVLGRVDKAYTVKGRIVDAETGKSVSNISYGYGIFYKGRGMGAIGGIGDRSDPEGNFRLDGVPPNHYAAFVVKESESEYYSDLTPFDVADADVSGLEIKVRRGSSISGVAVIEGLPDRDVAEKVAALRIRGSIQSTEVGAPSFGTSSKIAPDGSFRIAGLRPGKVKLSISGYPPPKGFALMRVERDGLEQRDESFDIAAGEQVSGVRVTISYGTGVIRGQLKVTGGVLPAGSGLSVKLNRAGADSNRPDWWTEPDHHRRFLFEGIPPGDYELIVTAYISVPGGEPSRPAEVKKQVTVTNDGESEVTVVIDLSVKNKDQ